MSSGCVGFGCWVKLCGEKDDCLYICFFFCWINKILLCGDVEWFGFVFGFLWCGVVWCVWLFRCWMMVLGVCCVVYDVCRFVFEDD